MIFKFLKDKTIERTMDILIKKLRYIFSNLDSDNVKKLDLNRTSITTSRNKVYIFDDFLYQVLTENDTIWKLNSGSDTQALDPAIDSQESGAIKLVTGDANGTFPNDGSQIVMAIPCQAENGGLIFETRLHINSAVSNISVSAGFTDTNIIEEPFEIASGDSITSNCSDGACFVYDTGADTDEWFACAVDSNTDDTGNATTGESPTANTYQVLRIEVSEDGTVIKFYIDGVLVKTLNGGGISQDVNLYATIAICSTTTTSKSVDVDYMYVEYDR